MHPVKKAFYVLLAMLPIAFVPWIGIILVMVLATLGIITSGWIIFYLSIIFGIVGLVFAQLGAMKIMDKDLDNK